MEISNYMIIRYINGHIIFYRGNVRTIIAFSYAIRLMHYRHVYLPYIYSNRLLSDTIRTKQPSPKILRYVL